MVAAHAARYTEVEWSEAVNAVVSINLPMGEKLLLAIWPVIAPGYQVNAEAKATMVKASACEVYPKRFAACAAQPHNPSIQCGKVSPLPVLWLCAVTCGGNSSIDSMPNAVAAAHQGKR